MVAHQPAKLKGDSSNLSITVIYKIKEINMQVIIKNKFQSLDGVLGDMGGLDVVVTGAAGDKADRYGLEIMNAVKGFVKGAVAAHNYEVALGLFIEFGNDLRRLVGAGSAVHFILYLLASQDRLDSL